MFERIASFFIKSQTDMPESKLRESYTFLAGVVGIVCNLVLFASKLTVGLLIHSIAFVSDAINNLSDASSSIVAVVSAKVSAKEADDHHPFGHGRFEYIASLIISFLIVLVGFEILKQAIGKVIVPDPPEFSPIGLALMIAALLLKVWMYRCNRYVGIRFNSPVNHAVAKDSLNDVCSSGAIVLSIVLGRFTTLPLDGIAGVILSMYIMYSGYHMAREMIDVLMGTAPSREIVERMMAILREEPNILGVHDCKMHDYGAGSISCSVHVEMDETWTFVAVHDVIDRLEQRVLDEMGIDLVIHIDPVRAEQGEVKQGGKDETM